MRFFRFRGKQAAFALAVLVTACQGSMGTTPPVTSLPAQNAQGGAGQTTQSAVQGQTVSAGATVTLAPDLASLNFPSIGGFSLSVALHSPSPTPSAHTLSKKASKKRSASPSPSPTPLPSPAVTSTSALSAKPYTVDLSLTTYPNGAPSAPTPLPSESALPVRHALVRAELQARGDLTLPSLDAFSFVVPKAESASEHNFSIAVFELLKRKKTSLLIASTHASLGTDGSVHTNGMTQPIALNANRRYAVVLYGDYVLVGLTAPASFAPNGSFAPGVTPSWSPGAVLSAAPLASPAYGAPPIGGGILVR